MENTGSFGAAIGGMTPELAEAISRRGGGGVPATSQVSNTAPTAQPQLPAGQAPVGAPAMGGAPTQPSVTPALPFDSSEAKMLIQAITKRLDAGTKFHTGR